MRLKMGAVAVSLMAAGLMAPVAAAPAQRKPTVAGDPLNTGAEAWEAGNYTRALGIWRPLAVAGDANAQYNLAQAYRLGRGVTVDEKVAQDWYYKAAQQNHPQAQANYGLLLFQNGDRKGALPWLRKAADRGDPRAQYVVGTALFNGDIAPKDWVRAYALMTRAAAAGLPPAITSLSEMDKYVPLAQRTQGTALARDLERSATLAMVDGAPGALARAAPAPAPVATPRPVTKSAMASPRPSPPSSAVAPLPLPPSTPAPPRYATTAAAKPAAPERPATKPVASPKPAAPIAPAAGGWRVQVGAYSDPASASSVWEGIARKTRGLALRSYLVKAGAVTRLQAGPLASRADASKACARITAASGAACFPVAAR